MIAASGLWRLPQILPQEAGAHDALDGAVPAASASSEMAPTSGFKLPSRSSAAVRAARR